MNLEDITNVEPLDLAGSTVYIVFLGPDFSCVVPNDPENSDYAAVQEWLALNP